MIMNEKYDLMPEGELFRLVAKACVVPGVRPGDRGGLVASERNLSPKGSSWIYPGAVVQGGALVTENACVSGNSLISGYTTICGNAVVNSSRVWGDNTCMGGHAHVTKASVSGIELRHGALGRGAIVESSSHLLVTSVPGTEWTLSLYRTGTGHAIQVGCQRTTLDDLDLVAEDYAPRHVEDLLELWLPMARALVASWEPVKAVPSRW